MNNLFKKMDWDLLRGQKGTLLSLIGKREAAINILEATGISDALAINQARQEVDALTGLLHLVDAVQDAAVDEEGLDEKIVFGNIQEA